MSEADTGGGPPLARSDWEALADRLLLAVRPHASPSHALVDLPGPASRSGRWSDGLEGFARTFLLAAFRVAGARGSDPHGHLEWYASGLAAGVDPASPERWPTLLERTQARVEAASIVLALHETRPWLWDRLGRETREHVVAWLSGFIGTSGYTNNWVWFQNVAEAFLRTVGGPYSDEDIERNLAMHERWYVGDGWYTDGESAAGRLQNFDHYVSWAMHFYPLLYERILGQPASSIHRDRLRQYIGDAQHLIAADGAPLIQGRSLTYRFAMLAPFWLGAIFDATPLQSGQTRDLGGTVLNNFIAHGAVDADGLLPIGWHGAFPAIRQLYTGPGSPYWASKGFAGLLLPADHPEWRTDAAPRPAEKTDVVRSLPRPGWLVSTTAADGIVRVANHGSDKLQNRASTLDDPFYKRHAYSTHAAPELSMSAMREPVDSHVALLDVAGRGSHRGRIDRVSQDGNVAVSRCRALWAVDTGDAELAAVWPAVRVGPWLTTASVMRGPVEVRIAVIDGGDHGGGEDPDDYWPQADGPWRLRIGGWALASGVEAPATDVGTGTARASRTDGLISAVYGLTGQDQAGVDTAVGANPLGRHSAVPWVSSSQTIQPGEIQAAAVVLSADGDHEGAVTSVTALDGVVEVRWATGQGDRVLIGGVDR